MAKLTPEQKQKLTEQMQYGESIGRQNHCPVCGDQDNRLRIGVLPTVYAFADGGPRGVLRDAIYEEIYKEPPSTDPQIPDTIPELPPLIGSLASNDQEPNHPPSTAQGLPSIQSPDDGDYTYTRQRLREGWLYCWINDRDEKVERLLEFQVKADQSLSIVDSAYKGLDHRPSGAKNSRLLAMPIEAEVWLAYSEVQWSWNRVLEVWSEPLVKKARMQHFDLQKWSKTGEPLADQSMLPLKTLDTEVSGIMNISEAYKTAEENELQQQQVPPENGEHAQLINDGYAISYATKTIGGSASARYRQRPPEAASPTPYVQRAHAKTGGPTTRTIISEPATATYADTNNQSQSAASEATETVVDSSPSIETESEPVTTTIVPSAAKPPVIVTLHDHIGLARQLADDYQMSWEALETELLRLRGAPGRTTLKHMAIERKRQELKNNNIMRSVAVNDVAEPDLSDQEEYLEIYQEKSHYYPGFSDSSKTPANFPDDPYRFAPWYETAVMIYQYFYREQPEPINPEDIIIRNIVSQPATAKYQQAPDSQTATSNATQTDVGGANPRQINSSPATASYNNATNATQTATSNATQTEMANVGSQANNRSAASANHRDAAQTAEPGMDSREIHSAPAIASFQNAEGITQAAASSSVQTDITGTHSRQIYSPPTTAEYAATPSTASATSPGVQTAVGSAPTEAELAEYQRQLAQHQLNQQKIASQRNNFSHNDLKVALGMQTRLAIREQLIKPAKAVLAALLDKNNTKLQDFAIAIDDYLTLPSNPTSMFGLVINAPGVSTGNTYIPDADIDCPIDPVNFIGPHRCGDLYGLVYALINRLADHPAKLDMHLDETLIDKETLDNDLAQDPGVIVLKQLGDIHSGHPLATKIMPPETLEMALDDADNFEFVLQPSHPEPENPADGWRFDQEKFESGVNNIKRIASAVNAVVAELFNANPLERHINAEDNHVNLNVRFLLAAGRRIATIQITSDTLLYGDTAGDVQKYTGGFTPTNEINVHNRIYQLRKQIATAEARKIAALENLQRHLGVTDNDINNMRSRAGDEVAHAKDALRQANRNLGQARGQGGNVAAALLRRKQAAIALNNALHNQTLLDTALEQLDKAVQTAKAEHAAAVRNWQMLADTAAVELEQHQRMISVGNRYYFIVFDSSGEIIGLRNADSTSSGPTLTVTALSREHRQLTMSHHWKVYGIHHTTALRGLPTAANGQNLAALNASRTFMFGMLSMLELASFGGLLAQIHSKGLDRKTALSLTSGVTGLVAMAAEAVEIIYRYRTYRVLQRLTPQQLSAQGHQFQQKMKLWGRLATKIGGAASVIEGANMMIDVFAIWDSGNQSRAMAHAIAGGILIAVGAYLIMATNPIGWLALGITIATLITVEVFFPEWDMLEELLKHSPFSLDSGGDTTVNQWGKIRLTVERQNGQVRIAEDVDVSEVQWLRSPDDGFALVSYDGYILNMTTFLSMAEVFIRNVDKSITTLLNKGVGYYPVYSGTNPLELVNSEPKTELTVRHHYRFRESTLPGWVQYIQDYKHSMVEPNFDGVQVGERLAPSLDHAIEKYGLRDPRFAGGHEEWLEDPRQALQAAFEGLFKPSISIEHLPLQANVYISPSAAALRRYNEAMDDYDARMASGKYTNNVPIAPRRPEGEYKDYGNQLVVTLRIPLFQPRHSRLNFEFIERNMAGFWPVLTGTPKALNLHAPQLIEHTPHQPYHHSQFIFTESAHLQIHGDDNFLARFNVDIYGNQRLTWPPRYNNKFNPEDDWERDTEYFWPWDKYDDAPKVRKP